MITTCLPLLLFSFAFLRAFFPFFQKEKIPRPTLQTTSANCLYMIECEKCVCVFVLFGCERHFTVKQIKSIHKSKKQSSAFFTSSIEIPKHIVFCLLFTFSIRSVSWLLSYGKISMFYVPLYGNCVQKLQVKNEPKNLEKPKRNITAIHFRLRRHIKVFLQCDVHTVKIPVIVIESL